MLTIWRHIFLFKEDILGKGAKLFFCCGFFFLFQLSEDVHLVLKWQKIHYTSFSPNSFFAYNSLCMFIWYCVDRNMLKSHLTSFSFYNFFLLNFICSFFLGCVDWIMSLWWKSGLSKFTEFAPTEKLLTDNLSFNCGCGFSRFATKRLKIRHLVRKQKLHGWATNCKKTGCTLNENLVMNLKKKRQH